MEEHTTFVGLDVHKATIAVCLAEAGRDGEVRFASAADRAAFAEELATAVTRLIGKYHDEHARGGRDHRVIVAVHPSVKPGHDASAS